MGGLSVLDWTWRQVEPLRSTAVVTAVGHISARYSQDASKAESVGVDIPTRATHRSSSLRELMVEGSADLADTQAEVLSYLAERGTGSGLLGQDLSTDSPHGGRASGQPRVIDHRALHPPGRSR